MKKRYYIIGILVFLCMAVLIMPIRSYAEDGYGLWVNGTEITSENEKDVFGDSTVSYDSGSNTLKLNGANLTQTYTSGTMPAVIYADEQVSHLKISVEGENTIYLGYYGNLTAGIYAFNDIEFTGSGSLQVTVYNYGGEGYGVYSHINNVTVTSGTYSFYGYGTTGYGIMSNSNSGTVYVNGGSVTTVGEGSYTAIAIGGVLDFSAYANCEIIASINSDGNPETEYNADDQRMLYKYIKIIPYVEPVYDENGFSSDGRSYQPAKLVDGYYRINNAGNLYWFAELLAADEQNANLNARLENDITIPKDMNWKPISVGYYGSAYQGTFDGNNKTISNLNVLSDADSGLYTGSGLFKTIGSNGVVKNLGMINPDIKPNSGYAGAICGTNYGLIENCYNSGGEISVQLMRAGGIAGENQGKISHCYNTGYVYSAAGEGIGGICGYAALNSIVTDCYNTGDVKGYWDTGGIVGYYREEMQITNCYNTGTIVSDMNYADGIAHYYGLETPSAEWIENCYYLSDTESENGGKTAAQFASGEVAWLLNSGITDGTQAFYQTCGEGYPVFSGQTVFMVMSYLCSGDTNPETVYSNINQNITGEHNFTKQVIDDKYLKSAATCKSGAVYYMICEVCGEVSEAETFTYGDKNQDNHTGQVVWITTEKSHKMAYDCCDMVVIGEEAHDWENNICSKCGYIKSPVEIPGAGDVTQPSDSEYTPNEPENVTTPSDITSSTESGGTESPRTGDDRSVSVRFYLFLTSCVAFTCTYFNYKKKKTYL